MKLLSWLFFGVFSTSITAATFSVPEEFQLLRLNEKPIEKSWFSNTSQLDLPVGEHLIKLKYLDVFEEEYDQHEVIESPPFWLSITIEQPNQTAKMEFERPQTIAKAKAFAQAQQKQLFLAGEPLIVYTELPQQNSLIVQPEKRVLPVKSLDAQASQPIGVKPNNASQPSAMQMLEFWWLQATPQEQQAFLNKVQATTK